MLAPKKGFTLVEMMISITLGSVLILAVTSVFSSTLTINRKSIQFSQLNEEIQGAMTLMVRDMRRIGYWANSSDSVTDPSGNAKTFANTIDTSVVYGSEDALSCITYAYDLDNDGTLDSAAGIANENMGFRLKNEQLEKRTNGLACSADGWTAMTDSDFTTVDALSFNVTSNTSNNVTSRVITITLTMRLVENIAISRTLVESVAVRNVDY